ncbi:MAG: hypothetical protein Q9187_006901, partial [Circinaria calcarea]
MPPKMPPTRRKSSNPTSARAAQPTLTFHSRSNKVTKPHLAPAPDESKFLNVKPEEVLKAVELSTPSPAPEDVDTGAEHGSTTAELAIKEQVKIEHAAPKSAADERAEKITDAQIKRYWKAKEDERKAPRVHQEGLSVHDKILREFDLSSQYGPCIGIARTKRWKRADKLGLKPPTEVLAVLKKEEVKNSIKAQRAHVDELMSS